MHHAVASDACPASARPASTLCAWQTTERVSGPSQALPLLALVMHFASSHLGLPEQYAWLERAPGAALATLVVVVLARTVLNGTALCPGPQMPVRGRPHSPRTSQDTHPRA